NAGGGGGWYGGGSGAGQAGAGGGSSYIDGVTDGETTAGVRSGDGEVVITTLCFPLTVTVSESEICFGEEVTLSATSESGDEVTWDMGVEDGVAFIPEMVGENTYTASTGNEEDCVAEVVITVNELPVPYASITADDAGAGLGEIDLIVTGGMPAYTFDWNNDGTGDFDDTEDLTGLTSGNYIVVVKDANDCESASQSFYVGDVAGIELNEESAIKLYPNPTTGNTTIQMMGQFTYQIKTINGEIIENGQGFDQKEISLTNYVDGIYLVIVGNEETNKTIKVVKK
ncbi:MAG: T9SS type A sorting domain-containing protein, partial [Crocinitomicaceae bacterium]